MDKGDTSAHGLSILEPLELQQLHLLGARFFEQLRQALSYCLAAPIVVAGIKQVFETFAEFCEPARAQFLFATVSESSQSLMFRTEAPVPRLILDGMFDGSERADEDRALDSQLSSTEARIFIQLLTRAFAKAVDQELGPLLGGGRVSDVIQSLDHPGLLADAFDSEEMLVTSEANIRVKGQTGTIAVGLPLSLVLQTRSKHASTPLNINAAVDGFCEQACVAAIPVEMIAVLAQREMSLAEVRSLKPGSVLFLQRLRHVPKAELHASGQILCRGTIVEDRGWHNFLVQQLGSGDVKRIAE